MGQYCFAGWRLSSSSLTLTACGPDCRVGTLPAVGQPAAVRVDNRRAAAGRMGGRAADTAWRASTITSRYSDTLF